MSKLIPNWARRKIKVFDRRKNKEPFIKRTRPEGRRKEEFLAKRKETSISDHLLKDTRLSIKDIKGKRKITPENLKSSVPAGKKTTHITEIPYSRGKVVVESKKRLYSVKTDRRKTNVRKDRRKK